MTFRSSLATSFGLGGSGGNNYIANMPAGVAEGDRLIAVASWKGGNTVGLPSGWSEIAQLDSNLPSGGSDSRVCEKIAGSSEPSTYTWTNNGGPLGVITIYAFSGRSTGSLIVGTVHTDASSSIASGATVSANAITALLGDDLLMVTCLSVLTPGSTWTYTSYTSGLVEREENANSSTLSVWDGGATQNNLSAGTTGAKTVVVTRTAGTGNTGYGTVLVAIPAATDQTTAPTSDVSSGAWTPSTGGSLFGTIDEAAADDGDYDVCTLAAGSTFEVALTALNDPGSSTGHVVHYRISGAFGQMTVSLRQGSGTEIASWNHNPVPQAPTTYDQTLSGGQADAITDYSNLRLRFVAAP